MLDPRLDQLLDVIAELVARDIANENAVGAGKQSDGVKVEREQHTPADSDFPNH